MSLSGGSGSSDNSAQGATNLATTAASNGATNGTYSNGPQNAGQINSALGAAQNTFETGTPTLNAGLSNINQAATAAGGLYAGADPTLAKTINGSYLSNGNPYFQGMLKQVVQGIQPQVASGFEANGRYGSGANANAENNAVANAAANLAFQNYGNERQIQNSDINNLPSYTAGLFTPGNQQLSAGYTPLNQFINQLKSVSPGTAGSFLTNTSSNSTGTQAGTNSGTANLGTSNFGAKTK